MLSDVVIDGNEHLKEIGPGETATVMVAFDPMLETAEDYTWTISTQVSNQDDYEMWRIRFAPVLQPGTKLATPPSDPRIRRRDDYILDR